MNISVENVSKAFRTTFVVRDLSFTIEPGQILGLLGPNGAGKTTTLRMILDILRPDEGKINFDGKQINRNVRNRIGYLPEERGIYQKYKVIDVLLYLGRLKNLSRRMSHVEAVRHLDRFDMIEYLEQPVSNLSKGLQQKLQLLISLLHNPDIIILDEPFWGLDPFNQQVIREKIKALRNEGKTILLSTHQLSEAEALCDYFVLIDHGEDVLRGSLEEIRKNFRENIIIVESPQNLKALQELPDLQKIVLEDSRALLYVDENAPVDLLLKEIVSSVNITRFELSKPSLNDIFLKIIKNSKS
ncbi:MAG: ATP-binding cassette domain-containing protein [Calditrichia bacterium]